MHAQPFIAVRNVPASSDWYADLLGADRDMEQGHPHRQEYDRLLSDGKVILQIHSWDAGSEGFDLLMSNPDAAPHGHGVLLQFLVDDFDSAVQRARRLTSEVLADVDTMPDGARTFAFRDPDGYTVVLSGLKDR